MDAYCIAKLFIDVDFNKEINLSIFSEVAFLVISYTSEYPLGSLGTIPKRARVGFPQLSYIIFN